MSGFRPPFDTQPRPGRMGPTGPFPTVKMTDEVERRWLHYAMLSRDGRHSLVANAAWLGPPEGDPQGAARYTTILLLHEQGKPWISSQFNASISEPPWSAFRLPQGFGEAAPLRIASHAGEPAVDLMLNRSPRPELYDLMRDYVTREGKGLRPTLAVATCVALAEINALPRTAKSFALAEEMLAAMQRFGSIEHASNLADRLARQGVARFERDLRFLPENPGKAVLRQVANYVVTRAL